MPKQTYALERGGPKNLELSWKGMWKNFEITLDGQVVGGFEDQAALKAGQTFTLPDGSKLAVKLDRSMMGSQLNLLRNGESLPGTAGDPEMKFKLAYGVLYLVGGTSFVLSIVAILFQVDFLFQIGMDQVAAVLGAVYLLLGFLVQRQSSIALGIGLGLYIVHTLLIVTSVDGFYTGIFIRLLFIYYMWQGFAAIKVMKMDEKILK